MHQSTSSIPDSWKEAWHSRHFRIRFIGGIIVFPVLLILFSSFLNTIEKREGQVLNDWLINNLPATDLSIPIFTIMWSCVALVVWQAVLSPKLFITFLWSFIFVCVTRIITIYLIALNPPPDLINLQDPLVTGAFYGGTPITKDLFYSGHTATMLLAFFCLQNKSHKLFALLATVLVGVMVIMQHVHYTIDVLAVPFFTYAAYWLGVKLAGGN